GLPLFHLYGDPPDDQAFDFIHIERIASRAAVHDWTIRAHRHRNLFQIIMIERGGGDMTFDVAKLPFTAPAAILIPAAIAEGYRLAMRGVLILIAVAVARLAASRARSGSITLRPADATVAQLRSLLDEFFRDQRLLGFYAEKLGMSVDRLNDHVKRATGVTAGHLIRQKLLSEAKRQLVFTTQPIHDIAKELAFADPSHFARFFRKQTGTTPHEFREQRGG